jgi:hypothetical protein
MCYDRLALQIIEKWRHSQIARPQDVRPCVVREQPERLTAYSVLQ